MKIIQAALAVVALAAVAPAEANLLIDGGFEQPVIAPGSYITATSIPGWIGAPTIEIQNHIAGSPFEGNQFVELDTDANSSMFQDIATVAGGIYQIHFQYSARPGIAASSNGINFLWDNALSASIAQNGIGLGDTAWNAFDFTLVATGAVTRVGFSAFGTSDSFGGYLDNVSVTAVPTATISAVPEPGTLQMLGLGLVILATVVGTRRRQASWSL